MPKTFSILARFLEQFEHDVEGRAAADVPNDIREKLAGFARGELPERERHEFILLLQSNPQWIPVLAREVKALRPATGPGPTAT
jgi:hypothetical protein